MIRYIALVTATFMLTVSCSGGSDVDTTQTPASAPTATSTPTQVPTTPTPTRVSPTPTATQVPPTPTATQVPPTPTPQPKPDLTMPNIILRVVRVTPDWMPFRDTGGWTSAVQVKESDALKHLEVAIWEETSSVHLYALPNYYNAGYGYRPDRTDEQSIAYREQFLIKKYVDMPSEREEKSKFLKSAFIDIASHLADQYPNADHHLMYSGHGGPGGALFEGTLSRKDAYSLLESWSQSLGKKLGVIDMGGPCTKGSFSDLENFCEFAEYYIASDMPNGGYEMDDFTIEKWNEVKPEDRYHDLLRSHDTLEEALKARIDLTQKRYEYSRNNMVANQVAQANYLYSCSAFRAFEPEFKKFLAAIEVDYQLENDMYQYMVTNKASSDLKENFDSVFLHKADNTDFFDWADAKNNTPNKHLNGMLMLKSLPIQAETTQTETTQTLKAGYNEDLVVSHEGINRFMNVVLPSDYDSTLSYPLILGFHGAFNTDRAPESYDPQDTFTNLGGKSYVQEWVDEFQFIAVSLAGMNNADGNRGHVFGWNGWEGHRISKADDVGFTQASVDFIAKNASIDTNRIFATGHSSGGIFTYKLATSTNLFRAIAPTAGLLLKDLLELPSNQSPISILEVHGTEDVPVPYNGGGNVPAEQFYSVDQTMNKFVELNGCDPKSNKVDIRYDALEWWEFPNCDSDLRTVHLTVSEYGHSFKDLKSPVGKEIIKFFLGFD
tara:strand:+ start:744 stop:2903 length:2160 start_codon:yes stop_codon:yes gene_type:complete